MKLSRRTLLWGTVAGLLVGCGGKATNDGTMLTPYLSIGDALAADAVEGLAELGAQVSAAAAKHEGEPGVDAIRQGASGLGSSDLAAARKAYKTMSDGMIEHLAAKSEERAGTVIVHCPMTFGGKGALWVQREGKVMNPYEGSRMLHCGDKLGWGSELPKT